MEEISLIMVENLFKLDIKYFLDGEVKVLHIKENFDMKLSYRKCCHTPEFCRTGMLR